MFQATPLRKSKRVREPKHGGVRVACGRDWLSGASDLRARAEAG